jgi:hypothetical protein
MAGLEKTLASLLKNEIPECRPGTLAFEHLIGRLMSRRDSMPSKCEIISGLIRSAMLNRKSALAKCLVVDV